MNGAVRVTATVVIVADDAVVIRLSTLRTMYEEAGDYRTLGTALGMDPTTLWRALKDGDPVSPEERVGRVRAMLPSRGEVA